MIKILPTLAACFFACQAIAEEPCHKLNIPGEAAALSTDGAFDQDLLDRAILAESNLQRCIAGLPPLRPLGQLRYPAQDHSDWMADRNRLTHKSTVPGLRTLGDRVSTTGLATRAAAENLALLPLFNLTPRFRVVDSSSCRFASPSGDQLTPHSYESFASKVVGMWMDSSGHRRNLLSASTTHMAAAATLRPERKVCGTIYVTQIFTG